MAEIEQMTSDERVRWVLTTPRSERPERGPLGEQFVWGFRLPHELANEVAYGFLTLEEAKELKPEWKERDKAERREAEERRHRMAEKRREAERRERKAKERVSSEARAVRAELERKADVDEPILHVVAGFDELKVWATHLEWGSRWLKLGKFSTMPYARIERIERRRGEFGFSRNLYIITTDGTAIELWSFKEKDAKTVTETVYRVMGGDHTKVGKINLA